MRKISLLRTLALAAVVAAACSNQKGPAEAALKSAQNAYSAVRADAEKYVPEQARAIQDGLASAQAALAKDDYAGVLKQTQSLNTQISALGAAIAAKKAELTKAWTTMEAGVPKMVEAVKSRAALFFVDPDGYLRKAPVARTTSRVLVVGRATRVEVPRIGSGHYGTQYDLSPDARRVYFLDGALTERPREIGFVIGWRALVRK
jgi:hypothetical protein